jgi:hypothetical protein
MGIKSVLTRDDLKNLTFEKLGLQFRRVIVTEEQMDIAIDSALQKFFEEGDFGTEERYAKIDVVVGQQDYDLPYEVIAVMEILAADNILDFFSLERTVIDTVAVQRPMQFRMLDVELARQFMQDLRKMFLKTITYDFNPITRRLHLFVPPEMSRTMVLHVYRAIDEEDPTIQFGNVYGHPWIKDYTLGLSMIQLADNVAFYGDTPLPNNMKVNYQYFLDRGQKIVEKGDVDLIQKYAAPMTMIVG